MGLSIPKNKYYRFGGGLQFDLELRVKKKNHALAIKAKWHMNLIPNNKN
jgi:hypothetical protein